MARVAYLRVTGFAGGTLRATGTASVKNVDLSVAADGIDLSVASNIINQPGLSGIGYFTGHVTGQIASPGVDGALEIFKGRYEGYAADYVRVIFSGSKQSIDVGEGIVRLFPAEFKFSGTVSGIGTDSISVQGEATVDRLSVDRLSTLVGARLEATGI